MKQPETPQQIVPDFSWSGIDTVLLDMDGTLLDSYFDDFFWEEYVPKMFAAENDLPIEESRKELLRRYRRVEKTLEWSNVDYWSEQLGLDIPELKCKIDHLIRVHPYVTDFLAFVKKEQKELLLVTNAHSKTLEIKLGKTAIGPFFSKIIPSHDIGAAKEQVRFWAKLQEMVGFDKKRAILVDDNANVLAAAAEYGLQHLIYVARPSSRRPARFSDRFSSITYFNELIF